jgi:hypothetical protein
MNKFILSTLVISSSKTDDRLKVILGNPTIIAAFKSGSPGNGRL